jgi:uncharacterized SAM-binding protein YcdF (DUF218 family)
MLEGAFLLKKFVSFFIEPLGVVITLFIIGLYYFYAQNAKKAEQYLLTSFFVLLLFSYPPFSNYLISNLEDRYPKYDYADKNIEYIHVLGNGHNCDITQPISSHLSSAGTKRVIEGIIIHKKLADTKLIFTGYSADTDRANSEMNAELANALGVRKENMILSSKPSDTEEEAQFCKTIVGKKPFVLVTSAAHMPRAMEIFQSYGLHPIAAPTDFLKEESRGYFRAPSVNALYKSTLALHEYAGRVWMALKDIFRAVFA